MDQKSRNSQPSSTQDHTIDFGTCKTKKKTANIRIMWFWETVSKKLSQYKINFQEVLNELIRLNPSGHIRYLFQCIGCGSLLEKSRSGPCHKMDFEDLCGKMGSASSQRILRHHKAPTSVGGIGWVLWLSLGDPKQSMAASIALRAHPFPGRSTLAPNEANRIFRNHQFLM